MLPCPRRAESFSQIGDPAADIWRADHTCSYCGSLEPERLLQYLEDGSGKLTPTDKNYKAYVEIPEEEPTLLRVVSSINFEPPNPKDWIKAHFINRLIYKLSPSTLYFQLAERGPVRHAKFYFQHFTKAQQDKFIALYNERKIAMGYPGHFYVTPYFASRVPE